MFNRVVIVRSTPIDPEPRARKVARWLSQGGWQVRVLGWDRLASLPAQELSDGYTILRVPIRAGFGLGLLLAWPLLKWQLHLSRWLYRERCTYDVIHAADFDTIVPAFVMARALHKRLIYDIYDFYADSHLVPSCLRWLTRNLEFWFIDRADAVIIADESRRVQLEGAKPRRLEVIYNTPEVVELRDVTRPHGSGLQIGYVGILSSQRGLTEVLDVLERHPEWNIDLAGYGDPQIVRRAEKLPNARFHGTVSYEQALELYARADVMIATYDPAVPNHRFSSPNKLFEAMMLGKPIIVAEGTSMDSVVRRNDLGFVVPYGDMEKLEEALAVIASWNLDKKEHFARRARQVYEQHFSWRLMQERLLQLYATLDAQEGKVNVRRRSV